MNESSQDVFIEEIFRSQKLKKIPEKMLNEFEFEVYQKIWAPAVPFPWTKLGLIMIFILGCALVISQIRLTDQNKFPASSASGVEGKTVFKQDSILNQLNNKSESKAVISTPEMMKQRSRASAALQNPVQSVSAPASSDQQIFSKVSQDLWVLEMLDEDQDFLQDQDLIQPEVQILSQINSQEVI